MHTVKVKVTALNAYAGAEGRRMYSSNPFAHSALEEACQHHTPATLPQERAPVTIVQGGCMDSGNDLDGYGKFRLHGVRFPDRPARSLSL